MQDFLDDLDRLHSRSRTFSHNGYTFHLEAKDPYGFWFIRVERQRTQPKFTESTYTTYDDAIRNCKIWAEAKEALPAVDDTLPIAPPLKKKRVNITKE